MQGKRTFIAIKIEPQKALTDFFKSLRNVLKDEKIKWVEENNLHLTLRFLGETSQTQINKVDEVLRNLVYKNNPFLFGLNGIGFFGSTGQPKVLFVSVSDKDTLMGIVCELVKNISGFGFSTGEKSFSPHLTLGRIKSIQDAARFQNLVLQHKNQYLQQVLAEEIIFFESILQPAGPIYKPIRIYRLNNGI